MNNIEIGMLLREGYRKKTGEENKFIKFPKHINVFIRETNQIVLTMGEKGICENMQKDASAFEAWCLILRYWIDEFHNYDFYLNWEKPSENNNLHYQRFLYRVDKFRGLYGKWFKLDQEQKIILTKDLRTENPKENIFLNIPCKDRSKLPLEKISEIKGKKFNNLSEHDVESVFASSEELQNNLAKVKNVDIDKTSFSYQLPIGVFDGRPAGGKDDKDTKNTRIFPGGKGAIDLWAIGKNKDILNIFELKKIKGNKKPSVGAISELFYYSRVMSDIQKKKFCFFEPKKSKVDLSQILSTKKINAFLLVDKPHPLISKDIINDNPWTDLVFGCLQYRPDFNIDKLW